MRPKLAPLTLTLCALAGLASAEVTRTVQAELGASEAARFAVENLAGSMRITSGSGDGVVVVATVHAESDALAAGLQFERRTGRSGEPLLRLKYPVGEYSTFKYPNAHGSSNLSYDENGETGGRRFWGKQVTVSDKRGVLLYADLEVQVPARRLEAGFFNRVGPIAARGLHGALRFDTAGGNVNLEGVSGDVVADTGSGDVSVQGGGGSLSCDTGSGNCDIAGFSGERLSLDTGSGDLRLTDVKAHTIVADTGSGDVLAEGVNVEEFSADTGSGDVKLRVPRDTGFELRADTGSGDIESRFEDAEPILRRREVVGYRRGDGRVKIELDTGSGDVSIGPSN